MNAHLQTLVWSGKTMTSAECCTLMQIDDGFQFTGSVVLSDADVPARIMYMLHCDAAWRSESVVIGAWIGASEHRLTLRRDDHGRWRQDHVLLEGFDGALDLDLGFSPATNTLAIRRLCLPIGGSAEIAPVWVDFPSLKVMPLPQRYTRLSESTYRFESLTSDFTAILTVDSFGMVRDYEGLWESRAHMP